MLPPINYLAPPVNPAMSGLYAVATLIDTTLATRISGGVQIQPINCGGNAGTWPSNPCAPVVPDTLRKAGTRPGPSDAFPAVTAWGWDQCDLQETDAEVIARAEQSLRLAEQGMVESALSERLATDSTAPTAAATIVEAVGVLELALAEAGIVGVIHASAKLAAVAEGHSLIIRTGSALRTPLGHLWAFGAGYDADDLHATSTPIVWRDAITSHAAVDPHVNLRVAVAERTIVAGYECYIAGASLTPQGG